MQSSRLLANKISVLSAAIGLLTLGVGFGGQAEAGCSIPTASAHPTATHTLWSDSSSFAAAVYTPSAMPGAGFTRIGFDEGDWAFGQQSIVGLWKFEFVSEGSKGVPDGTPIDAGYVTWHADGTELMNSGRAPMTGSFCMGVWKAEGHATYKLNHIALSWDNSGSVFIGPTNIRETVTVNRHGTGYSGKFTLDQYATDEKTLLAHLQGTVTATRITVD
jgi:hypothetical protein